VNDAAFLRDLWVGGRAAASRTWGEAGRGDDEDGEGDGGGRAGMGVLMARGGAERGRAVVL